MDRLLVTVVRSYAWCVEAPCGPQAKCQSWRLIKEVLACSVGESLRQVGRVPEVACEQDAG